MKKGVYAITCAILLSASGVCHVAWAEGYPSKQKQEVDNTGINERDAAGNTKTPENQSNNETDVEITRRIREAVTDDDSLSVNAQNVKIITANGKVTLRGPVKSEQERNKIVTTASKIVGPNKVQDQLEVAGLNEE